jgi:hypothetical protein
MFSLMVIDGKTSRVILIFVLTKCPVMLLLRTWAVWGRSRTVLFSLSVLLMVGEHLSNVYLSI